MKIKVNRLKLIASIQAKIDSYKKEVADNTAKREAELKQCEKQHVAAWETYEEKLAEYLKALKATKDITKKIALGRPIVPEQYRFITPAIKWSSQIEFCEAQIRRLQLSDEESLFLNDHDDYFRYL